MNKLLISIVLATGFLLSGCGGTTKGGQTILKNETKETIRTKIKEGKTTQNQIRDTFGDPLTTYFDGGKEVWSYHYTYSKHDLTLAAIPYVSIFYNKSDSDAQYKQLTILFNNNSTKTVYRYSFSDSNYKVNHTTGVGQ
ncbi:SmpA / OmlA family protein [Gilliamella bombicola]|uniref:SmpA / OmlA family protein n=1 Tax=Gilliamella bombicola TaxID=1798182 RepID=A0A1C3ZQ06_9GAMM|nr:outer membrane protein assembly factor BamE [Gilliamella bombicola]SCB84415.1 SmpA / OmlA family protein [Gilliamella bombicola]